MSHQLTVKNIARAYYEASLVHPEDVSGIAEKAVKLMHKEGKMKEFSLFLRYINDWWNKDNSAIDAKVISRNPLESEQAEQIKAVLKSRYGVDNVNLENKVDDTIIGGLKIEVGDEVIDDTLKTKLNHLAKQIAG